MERNLQDYKQNRILALASLLVTVLLLCAGSLNHRLHIVPEFLVVIAVIVSAVVYAYAAYKYRCPYCGANPECEEGVTSYGAKSCQSCGHELP